MSRREHANHAQSKPLRTSEIAAAVGVHPNTVRLYEEWGYLPSIPRAANGYRLFNAGHLAQMELARMALSEPFPGRNLRRSSATLVRLAARGDIHEALGAAHVHRRLVEQELAHAEATARYLEQWASTIPAGRDSPTILYAGKAAEEVGVTKDTLRHWERNGLIDPPRDLRTGYRLYGDAEIGRLRVLRMLTRAGYSTMAVLRMIRQLDHGRSQGLAGLLDSPSEGEDLLYAADRWLTTLHLHESRSHKIIAKLENMLPDAPAPSSDAPHPSN